ncbi:hypothetical protein [Megasphaera sp.]|nr:hypothetical protein [Megasphaera sp.]
MDDLVGTPTFDKEPITNNKKALHGGNHRAEPFRYLSMQQVHLN